MEVGQVLVSGTEYQIDLRIHGYCLPTGNSPPDRDRTCDKAATEAASLAAARQKSERAVDMRDTQIAGIALARHATLATRDVRHFADLEISIVDPWVSA
jgi:predicted nucleic acid-binding protein